LRSSGPGSIASSGRGEAALRAIEAAGRAAPSDGGAAPTPARLLVEEAIIRVGISDDDVAAELLRRCLESEADAPSRAEAMLLDGMLALAGGDAERAKQRWSALARELPEEPAAWVAAALLLGPTLEIGLAPDLRWPSAETERMSVIPPPAPSSPALDAAPALEGAIDWLLEAQRADGGWDLPFGAQTAHPAPDPIAMASQAICTLALARAAGRSSRRTARGPTGAPMPRAAACAGTSTIARSAARIRARSRSWTTRAGAARTGSSASPRSSAPSSARCRSPFAPK
jgi:hypothetical protein